jgi:DNA-directed RNA polymerase subunit RPC12/RpoP
MDTAAVFCPCCSKVLYKEATVVDQNASVLGVMDPRIEGGFMTCPHCQRKVLFERAAGSPSGWKVAPKEQQKCS